MGSSTQVLLCIWLAVFAFPEKSYAEFGAAHKRVVQIANIFTESTQRQLNTSSTRQCEDSDELQNIITGFVYLAYGGNILNFFNVLNFVASISRPHLKYVGLNTLFDELKSTGDDHSRQMMLLTYSIKTAMSDTNIDDQLFAKYNRLKRKIPSRIRSIIFGEYIRLVNVAVNEYMYESNDRVDGHRLILTWVPGGPSTQDVFSFDARMEANNRLYFIIRNDYFDNGSPMCQSSSYYSPERRKIVTCPYDGENNGMRWYVEPVPNTAYFKITNLDGTQLYSPSNTFLLDEQRRYVFTWQKDDWSGGPEGWWIVEGI